jgi:protein pelota
MMEVCPIIYILLKLRLTAELFPMRIIKFYEGVGSLKLKMETLDDLWTVQRIIFANDLVKSESERRFRPSEGDIGELKQVMITLRVEKTELDKSASRLRVLGKIVEGKPLEYVKLNSYHTLNIAPGDILELVKPKWPDYLVKVAKDAVADSKKPRLGLIVVDDEKALPAYMLGYGIEFGNEMYSRLSKRMSQKDFQEQEKKYFDSVLDTVRNMRVDTIVIAGPGFTKDDIKAYATNSGMIKKMGKQLIFESVSNAERSGIYELVKGEKVEQLLEKERIRMEFRLMEEFLKGLESKSSLYGTDNVGDSVDGRRAKVVLVNDSVLGDQRMQEILSKAEERRIKIEVFNSGDEVGTQLHNFKDIACME